MKRSISWLAVAVLMLIPMRVFGHATVSPAASRPGAYERYVLRVPNESDNPTLRVEMTFPTDVRVISFADVPGWRIETKMDNSGRALSAVWTGSLPPARFVEFPFVGVNPGNSARIEWPVVQIYSNGDTASWTGPTGSDHPASVTVIGSSDPGTSKMPLVLGGMAIAIALTGLVVALRGARVRTA